MWVLVASAAGRCGYVKDARRIIVRVDGEVPQTCAAHIDGVESGSVNRALGPFLPGEHRVQLVCGSRSSWLHRIALTATAVDVLIPAWELELSLTGDGLHLTRPGPLAAIEDRLLSASKIEWVLTATTGLDDRVTCRLRVRGQTDPHLSQQLAPAAVAPWVRGRLRPVVAPLLPAAVATQRARWWHWTLIGLGAALAGGGGAVHYHGELLIQETEDPARMVDRRPEVPAVEAAYISMYVAGAAAIVAGAILASATVGTADGAPKAMLIPAPGSISVHVTF